MRCLALAVDAEAAGLGHNDEAVMLKLTEPAADAVGGAAHFLHSVQVRQEDAAVVLLPEAPPALEMHIEPARAVRCCAPRGRVHHFEVDGHERREPALILARGHGARTRDASRGLKRRFIDVVRLWCYCANLGPRLPLYKGPKWYYLR